MHVTALNIATSQLLPPTNTKRGRDSEQERTRARGAGKISWARATAIECQSQKCNHSLTQFRRGATSTRCNCNIFTQWQPNKRTNARTTTLQITQWQLFNTVKLAVALALALTSLSLAQCLVEHFCKLPGPTVYTLLLVPCLVWSVNWYSNASNQNTKMQLTG